MGRGFVGRDAELAATTEALRDEQAVGALVVGEPGVGRSRLLAEIADRAEGRGWTVWRLQATPAARSVEFGPFDVVLSPDVEPGDAHRHLLALAKEHAVAAPLVLAIDDAHLLDTASQGAVERLLRVDRVRLVASIPTREAPPAVVAALLGEGRLRTIQVDPLARGLFEELLAELLDGEPDSATARALWGLTIGNPRYLAMVVDAARRDGSVAEQDGRLTWDASRFRWVGLREHVAAELGGLADAELEALEIVALGEPVPVDVARTVIGDPELAALERRGLVRYLNSDSGAEPSPTALASVHPVFAAVLDADMAPATRSRRAASLAKGWQFSDHADARLQAVRWELAAGGQVDPATRPAAAREALERGDFPLAEEVARVALDASPGDELTRVALADAIRHQRRPDEAISELARIDPTTCGDDVLAAVAVLRAEIEVLQLGRLDDALAGLAAAAGRVSDESAASRIALQRTYLGAFAGDFATVARVAREVSEDFTDEAAEVEFLLTVLLARGLALELDGAEEDLERARGLIEGENTLGQARARLVVPECLITAARGHVGTAHELACEGPAGLGGDGDETGFWGMCAALSGQLTGDLETAISAGLAAVERLSVLDPYGVRAFTGSLTAIAAHQAGRSELAESLPSAGGFPGGPDLRFASTVEDRVRAWELVAAGDTVAPAEILAEAGRQAAAASHRLWGALCLHDAARLGRADLVADDLTRLAEASGSALVVLFADHAFALAHGDGGALDAAAVAFAAAGAPVSAADAAAHAAAAHPADSADAAQSATRAAIWGEQCSGPASPALRVMPVALTPRQLEVARLVAEGESSRDVADRLVLSRRTVDNHLGRIYAALGVPGREELAEALAPALRTRTSVSDE